ncbi:glycoside hydrolase [Thelephora ganbajun]|uniref:Glycoside hydrolase n=1 Tax=Thelephora ganbajun TaxID=370292 RepID=A0ACB6ZGJ0_THEGA|nr:glycoside hydrolase [Thelephora ganbajun]
MCSTSIRFLVSVIGLSLISLRGASAFDISRNDNLVVYYGQNSYGATNGGDQTNWQKRLSTYCQDDAVDVFPLAFLHVFKGQGGLPSLDLANICSVNSGVFPGTSLPICQFLADDIRTCQARGKIVTLSLGGATGATQFTSDADAIAFADSLWNLFFGGGSSTRPFGTAVLDGVDLDIEGGSTAYYQSFVNRLQTLFKSGNKRYYTTAAPQCPFPDGNLGTVLNSAWFDAIYVQFYNNYCSLPKFNDPNSWNFNQWDNWAKTQSPNKNVKIYIGAPAAPLAANPGYYVDVNTLGNIAVQTRSKYSTFGGVMLWDASQAYVNNRYDVAIKGLISGGGSPPPTTTPPVTTPPSTTTPPIATPPPSGSCAGVSAWVNNVAYVGGSRVVYNGHLWTAKWWTYNSIPGGPAGEWTDNGACASGLAATPRPNVGRFWRD